MARYLPIGFHDGPGGNSDGIGKPDGYMPTLDAAGIPFGIMSADHYGIIEEALTYNKANHILVYRPTDQDYPAYEANPDVAARIVWQAVIAGLPPEFDKENVWLVIWNEPRKEAEWGNWLGEAGYEVGQLALRDGYKVALFGYSTGTPDVDSWYTPGMVTFLRLAANHPDQIAVALHEYSLDVKDIRNGFPYLVGRFEFLHDACDEQQIGRPTILITEWGWEYQDVPSPDVAMVHILDIADVYAPYENILFADIWYLGPGFGNIDDQTQRLIAPVTNASLIYEPPPISPGPETPPLVSLETYLWALSVARQPISLNAQAALQAVMFADGFTPVESEEWEPFGSDTYAYQAGEDPAGENPRRVYAALVPPGGGDWQVFWFEDPGTGKPEPPEFALTHWPADSFVVTQYFGENPENYDQYGLPGHGGWDIHAPLGAPFYCAASGIVTWASDRKQSNGTPSDYGWHVKVQAGEHTCIYAHAAPHPPVAVGDTVVGGQIIALSGNTGNSTGPHLHFELRHPPGDPGWPYNIIDPSPYLEPLREDPPVVPTIDMAPYFRVAASGVGPFFVLQHSDGRTENIQHQMEGQDIFIVKNSQYERLRVFDGHIERREDTSMGGGNFYALDDGYGWSKWCPRNWKPDDDFYRQPDVIVMTKNKCTVVTHDSGVASWLRFATYRALWTSPPSNASPEGITLSNVVELHFSWERGGPPIEQYWFAKGIGLVQWKNDKGAHSWISELPQGREPLKREVIHCF